ncbi:DUF7546 family protein [Halorussus lipolyticus]|uniref:DUF7546 family protein n=1 Tax=Halorussus lipolyticus TaxID=3034024 RepID=UPI0023E76291|nr:ABC transporter ATP-binding protein [Halorussus sp. DT80]
MATDTASNPDRALRTPARAARLLVALTVAEAAVLGGYLAVSETEVLSLRYLAYPAIWTNAAVLAVTYAEIPRPTDRRTYAALATGVGYFVLLCAAGGLASAGHGSGLGSVSLLGAMPGWGPLVVVSGGAVHLTLVPFKLVGYAGLATLAYGALARASRGVLGSALGLVTCVSCTGSVLGTLLAGIGGSSVAVSAMLARSYDLSTAVFLLAVGGLWVGLKR